MTALVSSLCVQTSQRLEKVGQACQDFHEVVVVLVGVVHTPQSKNQKQQGRL